MHNISDIPMIHTVKQYIIVYSRILCRYLYVFVCFVYVHNK